MTHTHTHTTCTHAHTHVHTHTHTCTHTGREIKALIKKQLGAGRISSSEEEEEGGLGNVGEGEASGGQPSSRSATPTSILEGKGELQKNCDQQGTSFPGPSEGDLIPRSFRGGPHSQVLQRETSFPGPSERDLIPRSLSEGPGNEARDLFQSIEESRILPPLEPCTFVLNQTPTQLYSLHLFPKQ